MDAQGYLKGVQSMSNATAQATHQMSTNFKKSSASFKSLSGEFTALAGKAAGAFLAYKTIKMVGEFDDSIRRLAVDSNLTTAEMLALKQQTLDVSMATGVGAGDMVKMSSAAYDSSKSMKFVKDNMSLMANVAQSSGASVESVGKSMGDLYDKTGVTGDALRDMVGVLGAFGKTAGREANLKKLFEGGNLGGLVESFKANYPKADNKQIMDYLMTSMFVESPQAIEKAYKKFVSADVRTKLKKNLGMDMSKAFTIRDVIEAAIKKHGGKRPGVMAELEQIFGRDTVAMRKLIDEYPELIKSMQQANAEKDKFYEGGAVIGAGWTSSLNKLNTIFLKLADSTLAPLLDKFGQSVSMLVESGDLQNLIEALTSVGEKIAWVAEGWLKIFKYFKDINTIYENEKKLRNIEERNKFDRENRAGVASTTPVNSDALSNMASNMVSLPARSNVADIFGPGISVKSDTVLYYNGQKVEPIKKTVNQMTTVSK